MSDEDNNRNGQTHGTRRRRRTTIRGGMPIGRDGLTERQRRLLALLAERPHGESILPSYHELVQQLQVSSSKLIARRIQAMERLGYVESPNGKTRACVPIVQTTGTDRGRVRIDGTDYEGELTHNGDFWTIDARDS